MLQPALRAHQGNHSRHASRFPNAGFQVLVSKCWKFPLPEIPAQKFWLKPVLPRRARFGALFSNTSCKL